MKIEIIAISKDKDSWVQDASVEYLKRLSSYADVELVFLKEEPIVQNSEGIIKKKEGERILKILKDDWVTIALDVRGKTYSSEMFAQRIEKIKDFEGGKVQCVIGGPLGLSDEVLSYVDEALSLSSMTLTHQMIRVLLLEQIYRAFEILKGSGYHK
jgi:23S rRNA (pseudouridine1915-N3)-methyltransferase